MDYFLMHEYIFKILIREKKSFVLKLLESIDIRINDYDLFDLDYLLNNSKIDILLFSDDLIINIQLNKNSISLMRNKIYIECIRDLMPDFRIKQVNINLFKEEHVVKDNIEIYNYFIENEYIKFITSKDYLEFKTKNKDILEVQNFLKKLDMKTLKKEILKEEKIKEFTDNLIKD